MRSMIRGIVILLCVCGCFIATAGAQSASRHMDDLTALYMVRASESVCGFKMTEAQRDEVLTAVAYYEKKLGISAEKAKEIYRKVIQSMEEQRAGGLCEPGGEWAQAFKKTVENFAQSDAASSAPTDNKPAHTAPAPAGTAGLAGLEAWKAVLGNTVVGRRDNHDYADYYAPDGKVVSLEDGEIERGKWKLKGGKVCTSFPSEGETCYEIKVSGDTATFVDEDGAGFRGSILKGNARNL